MIFYFDTSALIKKYIKEHGSEVVDSILEKADIVYVSKITKIECISVIKRLLHDRAINKADYKYLKKEIFTDFNYFSVIEFNEAVESKAMILIDKYQIKLLDSIQLASLLVMKDKINEFVACDIKLIEYAKKENVTVNNPLLPKK
ncbi:MAG: type II toxin-antitoxin system VapC family toxin [Elusimicrobia bacterium]|nr:type II toxin-antitoxin system VapC family toxin [Candidatus Liberimonas magnetica]